MADTVPKLRTYRSELRMLEDGSFDDLDDTPDWASRVPKNLHSVTGPVTSQTLESQTNRIIQVTKQSVVKSEAHMESSQVGNFVKI